MQARATYDDAQLIVKLYDMRREDRLRRARAWFSASFHAQSADALNALCPPGSDESTSYRMVTTYWEMVASFVASGVLNPELFYQSGRELLLVWTRIEGILAAVREQQKDPMYYSNLEAAAREYIAYLEARAPGSYQAFAARVRG